MRSFDEHEMELMDRPQPLSRELEDTLRQLEFLNRTFGGHRYARKFVSRRFKNGDTCRVLDLATGGADFPRMLADWGRINGVEMIIDAVDANAATVALAQRFSAMYPEIRCVQRDALSFESDELYDLVHCSLSVHHFADQDAVKLLRRCRNLSCGHVLVTDLERAFLTHWGVRLVNVIFRHSPMTIADGNTSARRAFSFAEFGKLAADAGWTAFGHERFLFCRQAVWIPA